MANILRPRGRHNTRKIHHHMKYKRYPHSYPNQYPFNPAFHTQCASTSPDKKHKDMNIHYTGTYTHAAYMRQDQRSQDDNVFYSDVNNKENINYSNHCNNKDVFVFGPQICASSSQKPHKACMDASLQQQQQYLLPRRMVTRSVTRSIKSRRQHDTTEQHDNKKAPMSTGTDDSLKRNRSTKRRSSNDDRRRCKLKRNRNRNRTGTRAQECVAHRTASDYEVPTSYLQYVPMQVDCKTNFVTTNNSNNRSETCSKSTMSNSIDSTCEQPHQHAHPQKETCMSESSQKERSTSTGKEEELLLHIPFIPMLITHDQNDDEQWSVNQRTLKECLLRSMISAGRKFHIYNPNSRYLKYRRILVDWIKEVGQHQHLQLITIHLSIKFMDHILGTHVESKKRLQLVAMACILIAAKFNEYPNAVPFIESLNDSSNCAYTPDLIKRMEILCLCALDWRLNMVTHLHFVEHFLSEGIVFDDDYIKGTGVTAGEKQIRYAESYCNFFAAVCLQVYRFHRYVPSVRAAAIVACARRAIHVEPIWKPRLEALTSYGAKDIYPCYRQLFTFYSENYPKGKLPPKEMFSPNIVEAQS